MFPCSSSVTARIMVVSALALTLLGCSRQESSDGHGKQPGDRSSAGEQAVSSEPASQAEGAASNSAQGGAKAGGDTQLQTLNSTPDESIRYTVPEGWSPTEVSSPRSVGFEVKEGDESAAVTAIGLPGTATQLLPNVNLWRKQIGLKKTTQADLDTALRPIEINGRPGHYIRLKGPSDVKRRQGILVVLVSSQDRTWFFKMLGDVDLVLRQEERFKEFVRSVTFVPAGGEEND